MELGFGTAVNETRIFNTIHTTFCIKNPKHTLISHIINRNDKISFRFILLEH